MSRGLGGSEKDRRSHRRGGNGSHPRPERPSQETMGFPLSWVFSNQSKNEADVFTVTPSGKVRKLAINLRWTTHLLNYIYQFLNKAESSEALGSKLCFFSFWQRQKPATIGLLLLSCCQVGDSVKIGAGSHLFTGTHRVAICRGALLVWPWLLLNLFFPRLFQGSKRRLAAPPPRVTFACRSCSPRYHHVAVTNTGWTDWGPLWSWMSHRLLFLRWLVD